MDSTKPVLDLDAIEARAMAATPGPWEERDNSDEGHGVSTVDPGGRGDDIVCLGTDGIQADIDHIAGMDPTTTLAIVAEVRRLRGIEDERAGCLAYIDTLKSDLAAARDKAAKCESYEATARAERDKASEEARLWKSLARAYQAELAAGYGPRDYRVSDARLAQGKALADLRAAGIDPDAP